MITATALAVLAIVIVLGIAGHKLRIWPRPPRLRGLPPESLPEAHPAAPADLAAATEAYAAYLNAPRGALDAAQQVMFDQDLAKARAAVETAWLQAKPVRYPR